MARLHCAVPKIRFKKFRGNWEKKKLEDIADKTIKWSFSGGPFGSDLKFSDYTELGVRVIQLQNIGDGKFVDNSCIFVSKEKANDLLSCNIYPNEILISKMGDPVARCCVVPTFNSRYVMCSDGIRLVVDKNKYHYLFVSELINNNIFRKKVLTVSTGSTRKRISLSDLKSLTLKISSLKEQTQIGNLFQKLDEVIELQQKKIEQIQTYKKAMLQKMFPQQGKTVPKIRFKGFEGNWVEEKLGNIFNFMRGEAFSKENIDQNGEFFCIHYGELFTKYSESINIVYSRTNKKPKVTSKVGDILIPSSDVTPTGLARASCLNINNVLLGGDINILRPKLSCSSKFFGYLINFYKNKILCCVTGTTVKHIYNKDIKKVHYKYPLLQEQTQIGNFFQKQDELIEQHQTKLKNYQILKKAMLQRLFV